MPCGYRPALILVYRLEGKRAMNKRVLIIIILIVFMGIVIGCGVPQQTIIEREFPNADAEAGRQHLIDYGCGACHRIEGIASANGVVGPPLVDYEERLYVAGELPNNANNLIQWIRDPKSINPDTAMPNLGLSLEEARDIIAYFYSR